MKLNIGLLLSFIPIFLVAQPDWEDYVIRRLPSLTDSLAKDPDNVNLIWERIDLLFRPEMDLYSKPWPRNSKQRYPEGNQLTIGERFGLDTLADLNKLIARNAVIKMAGYNKDGGWPRPDVTIADFYLKRGQYFYFNNRKTEAFRDFKTALGLDPHPFLKERICISIAAYYYKLEEKPSREHLLKALEYIDRCTPRTLEEGPLNLSSYSGTFLDTYERGKILLLEATGNKERLVSYLKNLAITYMQLYLTLVENDKGSRFNRQRCLQRSFDYLKSLHEYYIRIGDQGSPDNVIERMMQSIVDLYSQ